MKTYWNFNRVIVSSTSNTPKLRMKTRQVLESDKFVLF